MASNCRTHKKSRYRDKRKDLEKSHIAGMLISQLNFFSQDFALVKNLRLSEWSYWLVSKSKYMKIGATRQVQLEIIIIIIIISSFKVSWVLRKISLSHCWLPVLPDLLILQLKFPWVVQTKLNQPWTFNIYLARNSLPVFLEDQNVVIF